jgi:hypothetical protein
MPRTITTMMGLCLAGTSAMATPLQTPPGALAATSAATAARLADQLPGKPAAEAAKIPPPLRLAEAPSESRWSRAAQSKEANQAKEVRRIPVRVDAKRSRIAQTLPQVPPLPRPAPVLPLPRPAPLMLRSLELASATSALALAASATPSAVAGAQLVPGLATREAAIAVAKAAPPAIAPPSGGHTVPTTETTGTIRSAAVVPQPPSIADNAPAAVSPAEPPPENAGMQMAQVTGTLSPATAVPPRSMAATTSQSMDALPRGRNEPPPADAPISYSERVLSYWNDTIDYVGGGMGSLSSYLPSWSLGWSGSDESANGKARERLLVEAMNAAGFELASVTRDGTLVTTVTYTFRQQRPTSASDRLLAAKLATDLAAASGGLGGYFEQAMIKSALEGGVANALNIQTFELQTRPYPSLRSVAGPRPTTR